MVHYVYCGERFVNPDGEGIVRALMKDGLHPDAPGLEILSRCLAPLIAKYAGPAAGPEPIPGVLQPPPVTASVLNLAGRAGDASPSAGLGLGQTTHALDDTRDSAALGGSAAPAPAAGSGMSAGELAGSPAPGAAGGAEGLAAGPGTVPAEAGAPAAPQSGHSLWAPGGASGAAGADGAPGVFSADVTTGQP